jgi:hypothetical protein
MRTSEQPAERREVLVVRVDGADLEGHRST